MGSAMGAPARIVIHSSAAPLAMEFAPGGAAVYLRLSEQPAVRTSELEQGVVVDYDAQGVLVGFEFVGLEAPRFPRLLELVKARFASEAPALAAVEAQ
ncbi:MAG: DUF2283 domain-containing protein [Planctomycetes bacterium]|nr:DUF2283 domain-containing protein [Planctomycetota bacterium]MCB9828689.1 DUF2283 domain-containing protein [Planctomycetota bacterium]MCB9901053.1 DUF2283 domain-containing protein [Planctomycetota bacterium]